MKSQGCTNPFPDANHKPAECQKGPCHEPREGHTDLPRNNGGDHCSYRKLISSLVQWIGLREKLPENPIFSGKIYGFL